VTVLRAPEKTGRGDDTFRDWGNAVEHVVTGCFFTTTGTSENNEFRDATSQDYVLRGPANLDIKSTDRVRLYVGPVDPEKPVFDIVGVVRDVPSATGSMDHRRVDLKVWEG
jgi:hypothetical protein